MRYTAIIIMTGFSLSLFLGCASHEGILRSVDKNDPFNNPSITLPDVPLITPYAAQNKRSYKRNKKTPVALAMSGGGLRASNFSAGVMSALEEYGLLSEVDYLSTVSGGGLAASSYISTMTDYIEAKGTTQGYSFNEKVISSPDMQKALSYDYKKTLFLGLINSKLFRAAYDRGELLEGDIDAYILGRKTRPSQRSIQLKDVFKYKADDSSADFNRMVPYWIANATIFNDASIFPFIPQVLEHYGVYCYTHNMNFEFISSFGDVPMSVGVTASAAFPIGVPPVTVQCQRDLKNKETGEIIKSKSLFLHLFDGGAVDNLGVESACKMLQEDMSKHGAKRSLLIVVDAFKTPQYPYVDIEKAPQELKEAERTMEIGLDALHLHIQRDLQKRFGATTDIMFLEFFKSITPDDCKQIYATLVKNGSISATDAKAYKDVINGPWNVPTDFYISKAQQLMLQECGKLVVKKFIDNAKQKGGHQLLMQLVKQ